MRNKIALGNVSRYDSAAKMTHMVSKLSRKSMQNTFYTNQFDFLKEWDDELAYLAELNVRSCKYGHDQCRATGSISNKILIITIIAYLE